jgi:hypothetical protein
MVEESGAEKCSEKSLSLTADDVLGITGAMRSTPTSALKVMLMLPPLHLFIQQKARQAVNRLLGKGCSYVPNFGHSEVLIKMTGEMSLLLAPRNKFVTLNIFGFPISIDFPTSEDWSTECVDLILHRMDSFSLLMDLFARAELVPTYSLTF